MEKSKLGAAELVRRLTKLADARPNELDTQPAGFEGLSYQLLKDAAASLSQHLDALAKTRWADRAEAQIVDIELSKSLATITQWVAQARNNGAHWLLQNDFLSKFVEVSLRVSALADRRASAAKFLGKELAKDAVGGAAKVLEAAPLVDKLRQASEEALSTYDGLEAEKGAVSTLLTEARDAAKEMAGIQVEIESAHKVSLEKRTEAERFSAEAASFRAKAEERSEYFDAKIDDLDERIAESKKVVDDSTKSLRNALSDVRRQGLAGAFSRRARWILLEKGVWLAVFVSAVTSLTVLAVRFSVELTVLEYEPLVVSLLRRVALAAPLVWVGWYAARQVGRLNVIQEDYEYKAATALAFESYRNEIEASGDESLKLDLLKTTIKNFGDNPVRLWDNPDKEASTPTEELLKRLEDDGTIGLIAQIRSLFERKG